MEAMEWLGPHSRSFVSNRFSPSSRSTSPIHLSQANLRLANFRCGPFHTTLLPNRKSHSQSAHAHNLFGSCCQLESGMVFYW